MDTTVSEKVKEYLRRKMDDCEQKLCKLKRKRKVVKTFYIVTVLLAICLSSTVSVISITSVPVILVTILSTFSAILTGISSRFNFYNKKAEIKGLIEKLNKINSKLDYVISCNGTLTQAEYEQILMNF
jgi:predicted rRNA methylase YqxC with S4 and FtsJ domains